MSNGRTPWQDDVDNNKNIGGRLYGTLNGTDMSPTLGASGFHGTYREITSL